MGEQRDGGQRRNGEHREGDVTPLAQQHEGGHHCGGQQRDGGQRRNGKFCRDDVAYHAGATIRS